MEFDSKKVAMQLFCVVTTIILGGGGSMATMMPVGKPGLIGTQCGFLPAGSRCCYAGNRTLIDEDPAITEEMVARGVKYGRGSTVALYEALEKGAKVRIFVAGGSFCRGNGCTQNAINHVFYETPNCTEAKVWPLQVAELLQRRYPRATLELDFYGLGSTSSHFGHMLLRDAQTKLELTTAGGGGIDLAIFDYSCAFFF
jgi:hypothetical protein